MRRPLDVTVIALLALGLAACGGSDKGPKKSATTKTQATQAAKQQTTATKPKPAGLTRCIKAVEPKSKGLQHLPKPTLKLDPARTYEAVIDTTCGRFAITLDVKRAPKTSASFVHLSRRGFYDNTVFHRIVPGFVIQGGDPLGTGQGGPGYSVVEAPPSGIHYTQGVVAMAKTEIEEPGTSGSQFYVVTAPDAQLPADYALLGKVTSGQDTVDRIAAVRTDAANPDPAKQERPLNPVVIRSVTITESKPK